MTDPFLLSAGDDAPAASADRIGELARRMGVPRWALEDIPAETLDSMEQFAVSAEESNQVWGDLADSVARKLTAAGFRRHNPFGPRGGCCVCVHDDGVLVTWSATEYLDDEISPFEKMVEGAMIPALRQILQATGFITRIIPEGEDYCGYIQVTGWQG